MSLDPGTLHRLIGDKIRTRHCDRQAVVYVRQSTVRQVEQNQESTRLQYALADRACQLGWRPEQILVIDDDLGRSAASALDRPGFQRLVAEVGFGHIGLVLGSEVSRLARSCRDWHQLLEMCALFDTLIGDADGIYDPSLYNDRLLLGLKGTMSEAEIHILKARMLEGRRAKAQRGELVLGLPRGYVLKPSGEVALDPDEEVQEVIRLVFALFERRRSVSGVLRYLVDHDISPSAIEVSLQVAEDLELERRQRHRQWQQRLERATYEADLARRRYEAVDPHHRLVARTLERDWEAALAAKQALEGEHHRALAREPDRLTPAEQAAVRRLAEDIPALWRAPSTTARDRQTIARTMLDRVVVLVHGATEHAAIECHWAGGVITRHRLIRPVRRFEQLENFDRLLARVVDLRAAGDTAARIADRLNGEGWRPPKQSAFNAPMIRRLLQRHGHGTTRPIWSGSVPRGDDEVTLQELADRLGAHRQTVYGWLRRGTLKGRMAKVGRQRIWLVKFSDLPIGGPPSSQSASTGNKH